MRVTDQIQVKPSPDLARLCSLAKNLYNSANFYIRQDYFHLGNWLRYLDLDFMLGDKPDYKALPAQTAQQCLRLLDKSWKAFFEAMKEWRKEPGKFLGRPKPPGYKRKRDEWVVIFTNQQCRIRAGYLVFPARAGIAPVKTRVGPSFHHVRVVPKGTKYVIEVVYSRSCTDLGMDEENKLALDLGVNNLVTGASNTGQRPLIIKGGVIKSINQFFNKRRALLQAEKDALGVPGETRRLQRLAFKRNQKIHDTLHKASRAVIDYCTTHDIGTLVIGYNPHWKQRVNLGKRNNQGFVSIPFATLVYQLKYKANLVGMTVMLVDESYTSRASFLDGDPIPPAPDGQPHAFSGKRVSRGLYRSKAGVLINADVNGAFNILRKAFPNETFSDGIEAVAFQPQLIPI